MKFSLIGKGKTGGEVIKLLPKSELIHIFDSKNTIKANQLNETDVAIVFVPGETFLQLIPTLLESNTPIVIGSTGMNLPKDLNENLISKNRSWIIGQNFSLGIQIMRLMLQTLKPFKEEITSAQLVDTHHIHKKDAPSGTALLIESFSPVPLEVSSIREGDIVGTHELILKLTNETITLKHDAHSRAIFAEGAITVARSWKDRPLGSGLFTIENFFDQRKK